MNLVEKSHISVKSGAGVSGVLERKSPVYLFSVLKLLLYSPMLYSYVCACMNMCLVFKIRNKL